MSLADTETNNLADYIKRMGINLSALSRETGISEGILRRSVAARERSLRFGEAITICKFLGKNPVDFEGG